jgi:hypothetical protein
MKSNSVQQLTSASIGSDSGSGGSTAAGLRSAGLRSAGLRSAWLRWGLVIAFAVLLRLLPHPPNFAPVGAVALLAGAALADPRVALLTPLVVLSVSDLFLGSYVGQPWVYAAFLGYALIGRWVRRSMLPGRVLVGAVAGSLVFFFVTNLACWWMWYPRNLSGLGSCFWLAIPFYHHTLVADLLYSASLFGLFAIAERWLPGLRRVGSGSVAKVQGAGVSPAALAADEVASS